MAGIIVRVIKEAEELESLAGAWDSLIQENRDESSVYLTHEWLSTWWRHFGQGRKLNILLAEKQGKLIGIMPLMVNEYRIGPVRARFLETAGVVNCNYVGVVPPENRGEAINALLAYLEEEIIRNGLILRLTLVPDDSVFLDLLRSHCPLSSENLAVQENVQTLAPYLPLPATWDEAALPLHTKTRQRLRRSLRSLQDTHEFEFRECTGDSLEEELRKFFDLHQRRWQAVNVRGVFYDSRVMEFYRDIAKRFMERKWLHFSSLNLDGEMVSGVYGFIYGRKFYGGTVARDPWLSKYSLGHLHYKFLIKEAIEKNLREFDFLQGDEPYKFYWTKSARRYIEVIAIRKGFCRRLRIGMVNAFLRVHQLKAIKKYSLRELYYIYRWKKSDKALKQRERKQKEEKEKRRLRANSSRKRPKC